MQLKGCEIVTFATNGVLSPGFHNCTYDEFYVALVDSFPTSQSRKPIAEALLTFSKEVFAIGVPYEFWIDGSYVTTKINPNDADVILFFQYQHMNAISPLWTIFRQQYSGILDIYFDYATSPENKRLLNPVVYGQIVNRRNYWRGQFGFDREDKPKGIVRIDCMSIEKKLNEG